MVTVSAGEASGKGIPGGLDRLRPVLMGILGGLLLLGAYFLFIGLVSRSFNHAYQELLQKRYYILAIMAGFGVQVGLMSYARRCHRMAKAGAAGAAGVSGTGASSLSMVACCLHHVADIGPLLGVSAFVTFLTAYQNQIMLAGIAINWLSVAWLWWRLARQGGAWPRQGGADFVNNR